MDKLKRLNKKGKEICYIVDSLYAGMTSETRTYILTKLDVTACPYCNRNYINSSGTVNTSHLDHFINKNDYPIFAVSFYNLIPVCPACNMLKRKSEFTYSPHNVNYKTDEMLRFSYHIKNTNYMQDKNALEIYIEVLDEIIRENIEVVNLEGLYQIHRDVVQDLIKKRTIFSQEYVDEIMKNQEGMFDSIEEAYRILYSTYINQDDYGKRTLSKFAQDILKELEVT